MRWKRSRWIRWTPRPAVSGELASGNLMLVEGAEQGADGSSTALGARILRGPLDRAAPAGARRHRGLAAGSAAGAPPPARRSFAGHVRMASGWAATGCACRVAAMRRPACWSARTASASCARRRKAAKPLLPPPNSACAMCVLKSLPSKPARDWLQARIQAAHREYSEARGQLEATPRAQPAEHPAAGAHRTRSHGPHRRARAHAAGPAAFTRRAGCRQRHPRPAGIPPRQPGRRTRRAAQRRHFRPRGRSAGARPCARTADPAGGSPFLRRFAGRDADAYAGTACTAHRPAGTAGFGTGRWR